MRRGASRCGSTARFSSIASSRWSCSRAVMATRRTVGRARLSRAPAAQCSLPHGNGRRSRAAGQGHTSRNRSHARAMRSDSIGPSHSTTSRVLCPSPTPFHRGWCASSTRSAPRRGSRRTSRFSASKMILSAEVSDSEARLGRRAPAPRRHAARTAVAQDSDPARKSCQGSRPALVHSAARRAYENEERAMGDVGLMGMHVPGMSWREMREAAVLAEELGYSCITMGESWGEDALTSLAQLAAVTSRIRIGTSIVPVFARSPANLAMSALNMDRMSGGRFFLGLGSSGRLVIEDFHGEKFAKPLTRMREYIDIVRKAARGERLDHDGEFFHTKRFQLRFTPHRPSLPIYIAALSPPSLRLTGELADGWLPIFLVPSRMAAAVVELEAGAVAAGRTRRDIAISPQVSIYVTDDVAAARDRERPHIAFYIGGMGVFYHQYMRRIGFGAEADRVREAFQARERDRAAKLVTDEMVDAMTIVGPPQRCRDQIQRFFDAGVQEVRLVFNEPNREAYLKALQAVAPRG
ncbi:MAG: hypothetical protein DMD87_24640 [Candidatus Rokuibacteriota bacterium]|nr:MAG: hypothetical protein DMD87_24640 [Candidatus Rokubacteria bacterium]